MWAASGLFRPITPDFVRRCRNVPVMEHEREAASSECHRRASRGPDVATLGSSAKAFSLPVSCLLLGRSTAPATCLRANAQLLALFWGSVKHRSVRERLRHQQRSASMSGKISGPQIQDFFDSFPFGVASSSSLQIKTGMYKTISTRQCSTVSPTTLANKVYCDAKILHHLRS